MGRKGWLQIAWDGSQCEMLQVFKRDQDGFQVSESISTNVTELQRVELRSRAQHASKTDARELSACEAPKIKLSQARCDGRVE